MTFTIILSLAVFLISLVGTRLVIATLRKHASPEVRVVLGRAEPPPLANGGFAMLFALVIGLLGAEVDYTFALSLFMLAGLAMLSGYIKIPVSVEFIVQMLAVGLPLAAMKQPIFGIFPVLADHIIAGGLWMLLLRLFISSEAVQGVAAVQMIANGLGLCVIMVLAGHFPDMVSTHALVVATAGFGVLWWSWPPAKILLGKIGAAPAGLVIGYILLLAIQKGYGVPAFILAAYILLEGMAPKALRVASATLAQEPLARYIAGAHMLLVLLAVLASLDPAMSVFNLIGAYVMVALFLWFFAHKSSKQPL